MTTEPTHTGQQRPDRVPYELALSSNPDALSRLTSPLLDANMHPGGAVAVTFEGEPNVTTADALDPFQVESLVYYLTDQAGVRRSLEAALDRHLDEWDHDREFPRGAEVWERVRVEVVAFQERKMLTREDAFGVKEFFPNITDEAIERQLADSDTDHTRSKFMLVLAAPWPDGHERLVYFRDGAIKTLNVEG